MDGFLLTARLLLAAVFAVKQLRRDFAPLEE